MKRLLLAAALALAGCTEAGATNAPVAPAAEPAELPELGLDEVERHVVGKSAKLFDANPIEMYERGRLPGAVWIKFNGVTREALPADPGAKLVFYCANELCTASHDAARAAIGLGYTDVSVMPAGYFGWKKAGKPIERPGEG